MIALRYWVDSYYTFENGDGTRYSVHIQPAKHGGLYVQCNEKSLWRWHGDGDIKFLCGDNNKWTRKALVELMTYHDANLEVRK